MRSIIMATVVVSLLAFAVLPVAADVAVHLVDEKVKKAAQITLADGTLTLKLADGTTESLPLVNASLMEVGQPAAAEGTDKDCWISVLGGTIRGSIESFDGDEFEVVNADLGRLKLPVAVVRALFFSKETAKAANTSEVAKDTLIMANNDRVSGTLNALDADKVEFNSDLGDLSLERSRIRAILLAPPATGLPKAARPALRIFLSDKSVVELSLPAISGGKVTGTIASNGQATVALDRIVRIDVVGGRLVPLSTLTPVAYEQQSLDMLKWDIVPGHNVLGQAMKLRDPETRQPTVYQDGFGVHGPCRIEYNLDGQFARLLTLVGIDESAGRWADANVIVRLDGKELFRSDHIKWQAPAKSININVAGGRRLEFIVESGEHFDVQDRINWANPRLLRNLTGEK